MCYISERCGHEGSKHFGVGEDILIESDRVVGVTQLCLTVGKDATDSDGTGVGC